MTNERANPFNVDDFAPKPSSAKRDVPLAEIDKLAAESGFVSRSPKPDAPVAVAPAPAAVTPELSPPRGVQRRRRTGRNHQVNIRATAETLDLLGALSDELDEPFGVVLERALHALRAELDKRRK